MKNNENKIKVAKLVKEQWMSLSTTGSSLRKRIASQISKARKVVLIAVCMGLGTCFATEPLTKEEIQTILENSQKKYGLVIPGKDTIPLRNYHWGTSPWKFEWETNKTVIHSLYVYHDGPRFRLNLMEIKIEDKDIKDLKIIDLYSREVHPELLILPKVSIIPKKPEVPKEQREERPGFDYSRWIKVWSSPNKNPWPSHPDGYRHGDVTTKKNYGSQFRKGYPGVVYTFKTFWNPMIIQDFEWLDATTLSVTTVDDLKHTLTFSNPDEVSICQFGIWERRADQYNDDLRAKLMSR